MEECKILGCLGVYYAKDYCKKHYAYYTESSRKYGHLHRCLIENCNYRCLLNKYCDKHNYRIKHGLPIDLSIDCRHLNKGNKNNLWKGGIAEYPNHSFMKRQRLIILLNNPKCEICRKPATEIHHRNGNKADHRLSNLMASCRSCNGKIRFKPTDSKYRRRYGMNLKEMAAKYDCSTYTVFKRLKNNQPLSKLIY